MKSLKIALSLLNNNIKKSKISDRCGITYKNCFSAYVSQKISYETFSTSTTNYDRINDAENNVPIDGRNMI